MKKEKNSFNNLQTQIQQTMKRQIIQAYKLFIPKYVLLKLSRFKKTIKEKKQLRKWHKEGCPEPPPHIVKQLAIKEYQRKFGYKILIETGTFNGKMVEAQKKVFRQIFSIELGMELFNSAVRRFANEKSVTILHGDSGEVLAQLIPKINEPVIFWLDSHYSGVGTAKGKTNCPIFEELGAIFNSKIINHIILIDDARCFTGTDDYPTINQLEEYVKSKNENYKMEVKSDIIRFVLGSPFQLTNS